MAKSYKTLVSMVLDAPNIARPRLVKNAKKAGEHFRKMYLPVISYDSGATFEDTKTWVEDKKGTISIVSLSNTPYASFPYNGWYEGGNTPENKWFHIAYEASKEELERILEGN